MNHGYSYQSALASSQAIPWRIEDIIGGDKRLDFAKPFMPETFARVEPLTFLNDDEKRTLNQIRGNAYLCIFGLVEEFILPFVLDHANGLSRPGGSLMGSNWDTNEFSAAEPVGNVLMTDRPTLRWSAVAGPTGYRVEVLQRLIPTRVGKFSTHDSIVDGAATTRGRMVQLEVRAIKDEEEITSPRPSAPQAKFRVVGLSKSE